MLFWVYEPPVTWYFLVTLIYRGITACWNITELSKARQMSLWAGNQSFNILWYWCVIWICESLCFCRIVGNWPDFIQQLDVLLELPANLSDEPLILFIQEHLRNTAIEELTDEHPGPEERSLMRTAAKHAFRSVQLRMKTKSTIIMCTVNK